MDEHIRKLMEEYYHLISRDHHKDRDCHITIEKTWSYGNAPTYTLIHNGYLAESICQEFTSETEAHIAAIEFLKQIIADEKEHQSDFIDRV